MSRPSTTTPLRIGHGYDIHRLVKLDGTSPRPDAAPPRRLVLGGVVFESDCVLDGHSDADVLTHAICDALLGAAGLPDIGHFFPNTDPAFKGIDSQKLLEKTCAELRRRSWEIVNIDTSLVAEKPKIAPALAAMKARLAESANIDADRIGIKATTNEGVDDIGRGLAITAHAVALIEKRQIPLG
ncbi:2-C-methyl-D-erythritol 4-phosphate cytidylyltransferase [Cephaloticoccus capnophilus]|uniref:2-C-methyl-D-erythritol 2,4-cyclodiphosphate synthase n=1 Tax=Cephaloticoccus capnophilus TaxID=1548208 RepID=A0A139SII1_9BACT|nr:2-C-methyl-D-erythritol 2,4-cyclodiphosphate synthase [Cephaloticoccus capnophilus]KXU34346.1 2-C-methyl-D-erythritol 4-phosphate cytidylyltransferase [Cephaloticoccus capnophilus]